METVQSSVCVSSERVMTREEDSILRQAQLTDLPGRGICVTLPGRSNLTIGHRLSLMWKGTPVIASVRFVTHHDGVSQGGISIEST